MASKRSTAFNVAADKVILYKEWKKKSKNLYKTHLSIGEKTRLNLLDRPASVILGIKLGFKYAFNGAATDGIFKDEEKNTYMAGSLLNQMMSDGEASVLGKLGGKKLQAKINTLAAQAFEESEDFKGRPTLRRLGM